MPARPNLSLFIIHLSFLVCFLFPHGSLASPARYWIFFTDKGPSGQDRTGMIAQIRNDIPERCLDRRRRAGADIDDRDLPISPNYLATLTATGATIETESRWLNAASISGTETQLAEIRHLPFVHGLQPVSEIRTSDITLEADRLTNNGEAGMATPQGDYGPSFFQDEQAGVVAAHERGLTGYGVLIGILDSGYQLTHRAFMGLDVLDQYDFIFNDPDPSWDSRQDSTGQASHGTACLSVLAGYDPGHLVGVAPRATLALAKVEWVPSETVIEEDHWVAGMEWLEWMGVDVVSSSLNYRDWYHSKDLDGATALVSRAAERAAELGVVVCNSAGNLGPRDVTISPPADAPGIIAVAALDTTGTPTRFSSRGPTADGRYKPDIAALGKGVVCVAPMTWDKYARWNGTSLATPIVAGIAALILEAHPDWSGPKVVEAIRASSDCAFMQDNTMGYGLVNASAALDYPSVTGRVISRDSGRAVSGVNLTLTSEAATFTTISEPDGWFRFANLPQGTYTLIPYPLSLIPVQVPPSYPTDILIP